MCGICGELRLDGQAGRRDVIERMLPKLARRGPDFEDQWQQGPLALGHRRLAIIDLSNRANQPMVDEALGLTLVFNGSIYNYRELRADLIKEGYHFFSAGIPDGKGKHTVQVIGAPFTPLVISLDDDL